MKNKILIDDFLTRQFNENFSGTKLAIPGNDLQSNINDFNDLLNTSYNNIDNVNSILQECTIPEMEFCKYLIIKNPYKFINQGTIKITNDIKKYIETDYVARRDNELPVLTRWVNLPKEKIPTANYLVCILYTIEQLKKESPISNKYDNIDAEYGCICILGTEEPFADPMTPMTMLRNALGIEEGGNGVKLNRDEYLESVNFWKNNIIIK